MTRTLPPVPAPSRRPVATGTVSTYRNGRKVAERRGPARPAPRRPVSRGAAPGRPAPRRPVARRAGAGRRRLPRVLVVLAALLGGFLLVEQVAQPAGADAPAVTAGPAIAWPGQGQAAYTTSTIDDLRAGGAQEPVPIASVTKVMTAYVVLQEHPLEVGDPGPAMVLTADDVADTEQRRAGGESVVEIEAGEQLTELEALQALLLPSANNVAVVLARFTSGSEEEFVDLMNDAAEDLGLDDTHYDDASGMSAQSVSTAADQVVLYAAALRDPVFAAVSGSSTAELPVAGTVHTTNDLLGTDGFVAGKTGSHDAAGGCLVFRVQAQVDGRPVTITGAVLGQHDGPLIQAALTAAQQLAAEVLASTDARAA